MVRPASDTCYATVGTIITNLGVPSKLIGCIPKVADRYTVAIEVCEDGYCSSDLMFVETLFGTRHCAAAIITLSSCSCSPEIFMDVFSNCER